MFPNQKEFMFSNASHASVREDYGIALNLAFSICVDEKVDLNNFLKVNAEIPAFWEQIDCLFESKTVEEFSRLLRYFVCNCRSQTDIQEPDAITYDNADEVIRLFETRGNRVSFVDVVERLAKLSVTTKTQDEQYCEILEKISFRVLNCDDFYHYQGISTLLKMTEFVSRDGADDTCSSMVIGSAAFFRVIALLLLSERSLLF